MTPKELMEWAAAVIVAGFAVAFSMLLFVGCLGMLGWLE